MSDSLNDRTAGGCSAARPQHVERLVLQIHNASFPADPDEDVGRGSPYSDGARRFFEFAARRGFNAIQLGPRGMTDRGNPSPYDATLFSRNPLDLPLQRYVESGRLSRATWDSLRRSLPPLRDGVVPYQTVFDVFQLALAEITANASASDRAAAQEFLQANRTWLVPDALYGILWREHGGTHWQHWDRTEQGMLDQRLYAPLPEQQPAVVSRLAALANQYARQIEDDALIQWLLAEEARTLRDRLSRLGLILYGDLQVGLSQPDLWAWRRVFLEGYRVGAPPSRTNPLGQPWGYPVLDPAQFGTVDSPGPALEFVRARIRRLLEECDGVRIDHPHGWIDPWVYRADDPDPFHAVQTGARLFSSPNDPRHPLLAEFAIARPEQIDPSQPLYADGHVTDLDDDQVRRYSMLVDEILARQSLSGQPASAVACEVLSTLPYPVGRVLARHGLGRFRVTQKLSLSDAADVYRIEHAEPQDWIMLGTHDTPPIWELADHWCRNETAAAWVRYLAERVTWPPPVGETAANPGTLVNAIFTAMLANRTKNVVVFFSDFFGITRRYNEPGVVSDANWSLRVPTDFEQFYAQQLEAGRALHVDLCLKHADLSVRALRTRGAWHHVLQGTAGESLAKLLPRWLEGCRWFSSKAKTVREVRIADVVPLTSDDETAAIRLAFVEVNYVHEESETYLLPINFTLGLQAEKLIADNFAAIIAPLAVTIGDESLSGVLYDAVGEEKFGRELCDLVGCSRQIPGRSGVLTGSPLQAFARLRGSVDEEFSVRTMNAEQSNSTIVFGERMLFKLFRRLEKGVNPDWELGRFLTETACFPQTPAIAGSIEFQYADGPIATVGILQAFIPNQGDAWSDSLQHVRRYFEQVLTIRRNEPPTPIPFSVAAMVSAARKPLPKLVQELCGSYLESAGLLGQRTAEMHVALSSATNDPDFAAEPFAESDQAALRRDWKMLTSRTMELLQSTWSRLSPENRSDADKLLSLESTLVGRFQRIQHQKFRSSRIRCHGDYHLGQVLFTGDDFVIIDFEGEPARALAERRMKRSPLRDVAGMIRSFDYAGQTALRNQIANQVSPWELPECQRWAGFWSQWTSVRFLSGYLQGARDAAFAVWDSDEIETLLDVLLLEKVVYEIAYELNNRPWNVRVPLVGLLRMLECPA